MIFDPTEVGEVYEPAEDSDLLAEAAREHVSSGDLTLDVGTGSGYVAGAAATTGARVVASDVNPHACRRARERYGHGRERAKGTAPDRAGTDGEGATPVEVVRADLSVPFAAEAFDAVLFNPPYLPTDPDDERDDWMATALSGGEDGRAVVSAFLDDLPRVLAPGGFALLLVSTLTDVEAVVDLADEAGFAAVAVREESFPFETLTVLKLVR
ncbi:methyltransferase [Halobacteriales archaeon SW_7_71_33]|nr:MAG: methyltransferase [Halobacteriales archaeon SW_7_71_33]